ncbi:MAG: ABC transporter ATP-binding protein [Actinomycetota bacterium]
MAMPDSAARSPVIRAGGVAKSYGDHVVLRDISVDISPGLTGLLGANGAGKTTLLSLVLGVDQRDGGQLEVLGQDPTIAGPEIRARIGYSPEHHHLPADVQAADLVRHLAQLHGLPAAASNERASDALWLVGLGEERFRPIGTMSTGQRQRVKLAAAIAHDPLLVLLDEPTDGLDPVQRDAMLALIRRIGTDYGISMVMSSHLLEEVERTCDHVVIIADGSVRLAGELAELRQGGSGIVVEVDERSEQVAEALRRRGRNVEIRSGQLLVSAPVEAVDTREFDGAVYDEIRDSVVEAGVGLRRLTERTITLEDLFLDAGAVPAGGDS